MNILEFIASIEALPPQVMAFAREKSALASRFGLVDSPATLAYDIQQTRIPDRALDGYIAKHVLSHPGISDESFADYAFTASAIFAALQLSIRSGYQTRRLDIEYPHFIFGSLSPCISRIVGAIDDIPLSLSYRGEAPNTAEQNSIWESLRRLVEERTAMRPIVEQVLPFFECPNSGGIDDGKSEMEFLRQVSFTKGKVGLLIISGLLDAGHYIQAFDSLQSRLSEVAVVLIYARRAIVDECCSVLVSRHVWRGVVVKHLAYQKELLATDFALLALQANFYNCEEAHRAVDFS